MAFQILVESEFEEAYEALSSVEKIRMERFILQLKENPLMVGKPLGYLFFREKKFDGKRLYYLVYELWKCVLLTGISGKKDQSLKISQVKGNLDDYRQSVEKQLKEKGLI